MGGGASGGGTAKQSPWEKQIPYLMKGLGRAETIYGQNRAQGPWQGDLYAPTDPRSTEAINAGWGTANAQRGMYDPAVLTTQNLIADQRGNQAFNDVLSDPAGLNRANTWADQMMQPQDYSGLDQFNNMNLGLDRFGNYQNVDLGLGDFDAYKNLDLGLGAYDKYQNIDLGLGRYDKFNNVDVTQPLDRFASGAATKGFNQYGGQANTVPTTGLTSDVLNATLRGEYLDIDKNPYIMGAMDAATRPVEEQLLRSILPQTDSQAILQGAYGGSANAVQRGQAIGDTTQAMGDIRAQMAADNYARERGIQSTMSESERNRLTSANEAERNRGLQALSQKLGIELDASKTKSGLDLSEQQLMLNALNSRTGFDLDRYGLGLNALNAKTGYDLQGKGLSLDALKSRVGYDLSGKQLGLDALSREVGYDLTGKGMSLDALRTKYGLGQADRAQATQAVLGAGGLEQSRNALLAEIGNSINNRALSAGALLPQLGNAQMQPFANMLDYGNAATTNRQRELDNARARFEMPGNFEWDQLERYRNAISGANGGTTTQSGGGGASPALMGAVGGGLTGGMAGGALASSAMMAPLVAANPWLIPLIIGGGAAFGAGGGAMLA